MQQLEPQTFATWAEPIEMLYACHDKVKRFCRQLRLLPAYLQEQGVNQAVKNDVRQILTYFNLSAPLHHEDEEKDFFPLLVKFHPQAKAQVEELEKQHEILHANWAELSEQLEALLAGKRTSVDKDLIERFIGGYDTHIAIEEPLFELGKRYLSSTDLRIIGKIMSERRKT